MGDEGYLGGIEHTYFMNHQPMYFKQLVETEAAAVEGVFQAIQKEGEQVFFAKDADVIHRYSVANKRTTIVKALVTEAPLLKLEGVYTVTLEKLLVDLLCDTALFVAFQGHEITTIYSEAFSRFAINQHKLLRYAQRRGKRSVAEKLLKSLDVFSIVEASND